MANATVPVRQAPVVRFKDLSIDATDVALMARFWSDALGLDVAGDGRQVRLVGPTPAHTVWINQVPEPKSAKNRMHLDIHGARGESEVELIAAGQGVVQRLPGWTVLADPEGGEFCLFERDQPPAYRLYEVVLDAADPLAVATWWADILGTMVQRGGDSSGGDDSGGPDEQWYFLTVPAAPFDSLVVEPVTEPKSGKNRVHLDVATSDLPALLAAGATVLQKPGDDTAWYVLADPEGNEFCAFETPAA